MHIEWRSPIGGQPTFFMNPDSYINELLYSFYILIKESIVLLIFVIVK